MTVMAGFWFGAGVLAGVGEAVGLWRSAREPRRASWVAALRLALVGFVLLIAAWSGELFPTVWGWGSGLIASALWLLARGTV